MDTHTWRPRHVELLLDKTICYVTTGHDEHGIAAGVVILRTINGVCLAVADYQGEIPHTEEGLSEAAQIMRDHLADTTNWCLLGEFADIIWEPLR
jgi:hypothetical protein